MVAVRIALPALLFIGLAATVATARPPSPDGAQLDRVLARLDLDDETRASVEAVAEQSRVELEANRNQVGAARAALRELMEADAPEESAVMGLAAELGALEQAALETRLKTLLAIRSLLTPEQRQALRALRGEQRAGVEDACREDAEMLCGDLEDRGATGRCLVEQRDALSEPCREALSTLHRRGPFHGR